MKKLPRVFNKKPGVGRPPLVIGANHPDDLAVDRFVAAMKAKLAKKRDEGYSGWEDAEQCSMPRLLRLLEGHILKGDPIDVSNIAMMIHQRAMMGLVE